MKTTITLTGTGTTTTRRGRTMYTTKTQCVDETLASSTAAAWRAEGLDVIAIRNVLGPLSECIRRQRVAV